MMHSETNPATAILAPIRVRLAELLGTVARVDAALLEIENYGIDPLAAESLYEAAHSLLGASVALESLPTSGLPTRVGNSRLDEDPIAQATTPWRVHIAAARMLVIAARHMEHHRTPAGTLIAVVALEMGIPDDAVNEVVGTLPGVLAARRANARSVPRSETEELLSLTRALIEGLPPLPSERRELVSLPVAGEVV